MVLPVWNPQNPSVGDKVARAIVYFVALIYMFLGMSIIADRFMSSIEVSNRLITTMILLVILYDFIVNKCSYV